jgi:hypothetical protein
MRRREILAALSILPFAAGAARAADKKGGGAGFIQLPTLTAAIVRGDGQRGVLTVEAGIDTPDPTLRPQVLLVLPRLRDAYATSLMIIGNGLPAGTAPDLDKLEARLQADTDRIMGRKGARFLLGTTLIN